MKSKSILKKLQMAMLAFGIAMGFIFPVYANFFVEWKEGMFIWFVAGCMMAGLTVGLMSFWFVKVILLKPLKLVSEIATQIENQNITNKIKIESNDEVGNIVNGLNGAITNIQHLFEEISHVFHASEKILSKVSHNESDKNNRGAIDTINQSIVQVQDSAKKIEHYSESIVQTINKGKNITECTQTKQQGTVSQVKDISDTMNSLVEHSKKINTILKIIEDIAGQTNILSLNASVEAARAREHGKGFAVVAEEIRKLATDTSDSSKTISETIKLMQYDVNQANNSVNQITELVEANNNDINDIHTQFGKIDESIQENLNYNHQLFSSIHSLNQSFSEVSNSFNTLSNNLSSLQGIIDKYEY